MSRVSGKNTVPEWILRSGLHQIGLRFRVTNNHIIGKPDIVFRRQRIAIFVHGCYWHRHEKCRHATMPGTNKSFWKSKFSATIKRDKKVQNELMKDGWTVIVVWECELRESTLSTIRRVASQIDPSNLDKGSKIADRIVSLDARSLLRSAHQKVQTRLRRTRRDIYGSRS